ncbi:MAG: hypothetical protein IJW32_03605 [Clostridia bacterium]|nr:hypothetical protein [Clostridia bacterium]
MENNTCSFFGHRDIEITQDLIIKLKLIIEDLIVNKEYTTFYFGGFGKFDDLCYKIVSELKIKKPFIKRVFCLSDPRHTRASKRPKWLNKEEYEDYIYLNLEFDYWYQRIYFRNIEMINQSDFIIFYVNKTENSGAYKALQYAKKKRKSCINVLTILNKSDA